jgi:sulfur carrier protein
MSVLVSINGERRQIPARATVADVLALLDVPAGARGVAVALEGEVVPRGAWESTTVPDDARLEVLAAIQGG